MTDEPHTIEITISLPAIAVGLAILKAFGLIDWSWWAVLSPIWFPYVVIALVAVAKGITDSLKEDNDVRR